jgi:hypothetical protein
MKVAALGALSALIAFPAQAGQRNHQNNVSPFCDNDGHCTTFNLAAPVSSKTQSLRGRSLHRAVDVNGNTMMVTVQRPMASTSRCTRPTPASSSSSCLAEGARLQGRPPHQQMLFARGHVPRSNHYIGAACDNQTGWNKALAQP